MVSGHWKPLKTIVVICTKHLGIKHYSNQDVVWRYPSFSDHIEIRIMVCQSLSYYGKDTRLKVNVWQTFEARIIETWRPNSETPGLQFKYQVPTGVDAYYCCLCAHLLFVVWSQFVGEKRWVPERMDAYYCCCLCACCCLLVKKDAYYCCLCAGCSRRGN